jgi:hypothetical protein
VVLIVIIISYYLKIVICQLAGEDDTTVKKRMGLYLERKLETSIVEVVNTLLSENNSEVNHSANKSVHRRKNGHVK